MSTDIQPDFIVGEDPDPDLLDETVWARKAIRNGLKTLNESLQRMITLCTALLAGSAAFFGQIPTHSGIKAAAAVCFMVGLGVSFWGAMPFTRKLNPMYPEEARRIRETAAKVLRRCVWVAAGAVVMGFVVLTLGLLLAPQPPATVNPPALPAGQAR
jgi:hypothetical protein